MLLIDRNTLNGLNEKILEKYKKTAFSLALLLLVCGILCLFFPFYAGVALSYLTGVLLVACGIFSLTSIYTFRKSGKLAIFCLIIFGLIYSVMGVAVFLSPLVGMNILSATICFLFLLAGICRLSAAFKNAIMVGRYWCMLIGFLDLVIAFIWLGANEDTTFVLTSVFIGLEMISSSFTYFILYNKFWHLLKRSAIHYA